MFLPFVISSRRAVPRRAAAIETYPAETHQRSCGIDGYSNPLSKSPFDSSPFLPSLPSSAPVAPGRGRQLNHKIITSPGARGKARAAWQRSGARTHLQGGWLFCSCDEKERGGPHSCTRITYTSGRTNQTNTVNTEWSSGARPQSQNSPSFWHFLLRRARKPSAGG